MLDIMPPSAKLRSSYVLRYENLYCERVSRERDYALEGSLSVAITRTQFIAGPFRFSAAGTLTVLEIEPWPPCAGHAKSRRGKSERHRSTVSYNRMILSLVSTSFLHGLSRKKSRLLSPLPRRKTSKRPPFKREAETEKKRRKGRTGTRTFDRGL